MNEELHDHNHENHAHGVEKSALENEIGVEILESIDATDVVNFLTMTVLMVGIMYWHKLRIKNTLDPSFFSQIDFEKLTKKFSGGLTTAISLPVLYHTVGHKYGLPHFQGEHLLGEIGFLLGAGGASSEKFLKYMKIIKYSIQNVIKAPKIF